MLQYNNCHKKFKIYVIIKLMQEQIKFSKKLSQIKNCN